MIVWQLVVVWRFFDFNCFAAVWAVEGDLVGHPAEPTMRSESWPDRFLAAHGAPSAI
jgi:hypothetical protein